jgi:hypothetical protein
MRSVQEIEEVEFGPATKSAPYPEQSIRSQPKIEGREIIDGRVNKEDLHMK